MFIGRERELKSLRRLYDASGFQFPVIYGRRRVGKTSLIAEFTRDLPRIYFTAVEDDAPVNLRNLSREIAFFRDPGALPESTPLYPDFQTAFEAIFALARDERVVFVIDEYPYLAKAYPAVSSILQALIDRNAGASRLYLILCGSSLSFMKEQVLGDKSPLYGRRTAQIEVRPFDFFQARRFFPSRSADEAAAIYGMVGGMPLYLRQFEGDAGLAQSVERAFFEPDSILYEEPTNLLKQEVQKAARFNAVIGAIAEGSSAHNQIATAAHLSSSELTYYLAELSRIGVVAREEPVLGGGPAVYRLRDNLFRFWYRFVYPRKTMIELGMGDRAADAAMSGMSDHMGPVFEEICAQWLWRESVAGSLPVMFDRVGRWWGNDSVARAQADIDLVAVEGGAAVLLGECKWRNELVAEPVLKRLESRAGLVRAAPGVFKYAFSKTGFSRGALEHAGATAGWTLVSLADMD